jgi:hypothetical protein
MTEADIIKCLSQSIDDQKYPFQCPNAFIYLWECDYWTLTAEGEAREFEIKISRSDFFQDAKKDKHKEAKGANYFYYVVPRHLIKPEEVDKRYGLIYVWDTGFVEIVKKPRRLHTERFDNWKMLANKMYWRFRQLWREKYIAKEITREEYYDGFNLSLEEYESPELLTPVIP